MTSAVSKSILCADSAWSINFLIISLSVVPVASNEQSIPRSLHMHNAMGDLLIPFRSISTGFCLVKTCIVLRSPDHVISANHSVVILYKFFSGNMFDFICRATIVRKEKMYIFVMTVRRFWECRERPLTFPVFSGIPSPGKGRSSPHDRP